MDAHGENDDDPQGLQRLDDEFRRQAGNGEIQGHEGRDDGIGCQGMGKKDGDDEDHRSDDLDARIEFMQKRRARKILAQSNISEHGPCLLSGSQK